MAPTRHGDHLDQAHADLQLLTKKITTGTADRPRHPRVIDLALERMTEWASTTPPRNNGTRGGSSSPIEIGERAEDRKVGRNATIDHQTALALIRTIAVATERLHALTLRYTKTIDHTQLPKPEETIPGCVSCARTKKKGPLTIGGHFAPIYENRPYHRTEHLCRWCGDHQLVNGTLPPIEACDVYHREGAQAAGRWLTRRTAPKRRAS